MPSSLLGVAISVPSFAAQANKTITKLSPLPDWLKLNFSGALCPDFDNEVLGHVVQDDGGVMVVTQASDGKLSLFCVSSLSGHDKA